MQHLHVRSAQTLLHSPNARPYPMNSDYIPWKILSANIAVGVLTDGWNLATTPAPAESDEDPPEPNARSFSVFIPFASPFQYPPVVHLGLTGFDSDQRDSSRLTVSSQDISAAPGCTQWS